MLEVQRCLAQARNALGVVVAPRDAAGAGPAVAPAAAARFAERQYGPFADFLLRSVTVDWLGVFTRQ